MVKELKKEAIIMAHNTMGGDMNRNYDEMSREELVDLIGTDVDPTMSREDLIMMAMAAEEQR